MGAKCSRVTMALGVVTSVFVVSLVASSWAGAAGSAAPVDVSVRSTSVWTDTRIAVHAGDSVRIAASGFVHFGRSPIERVAPSGIAWGSRCLSIVKSSARFPAHGLSCWSLIARIGNGRPFEIGTAGSFRAPVGGELFLGVNDNDLADNSGSWSAAVTNASPIPRQTPTPAPIVGAKHTTSRTLIATLAAGAAVAAIFAMAVGLFRRRRAARRTAFALPPTLLAGRVTVRIKPDRSIRRIGGDGIEYPFVVLPTDFSALPAPETPRQFTWQGFEFRAVKSQAAFKAPYGEVLRVGQYVAASDGVIAAPHGYTKGRIPLSLPGTWTFALGAVSTHDTEDFPTADGEIATFVRADQPFGPQADAITASVATFLADLDVRVKAHAPTTAVAQYPDRRPRRSRHKSAKVTR